MSGLVFCKGCGKDTSPEIHSGCDQSGNPHCAWHIEDQPVQISRKLFMQMVKEAYIEGGKSGHNPMRDFDFDEWCYKKWNGL